MRDKWVYRCPGWGRQRSLRVTRSSPVWGSSSTSGLPHLVFQFQSTSSSAPVPVYFILGPAPCGAFSSLPACNAASPGLAWFHGLLFYKDSSSLGYLFCKDSSSLGFLFCKDSSSLGFLFYKDSSSLGFLFCKDSSSFAAHLNGGRYFFEILFFVFQLYFLWIFLWNVVLVSRVVFSI